MTPPSQVPLTMVSIRGQECAFPRTCCCCGAPAERDVPITRTKNVPLVVAIVRRSLTIAVPCCAPCATRVDWVNRGGFVGLIPKGIGCLIGSMFLSGCLISVPLVVLLALLQVPEETRRAVRPWDLYAGMAVILSGWLWWESRRRPRGSLGPDHVCSAYGAVYLRRFDGASMTLAFMSEAYAHEFAAANADRVTGVASSTLGAEIGRR